MTDWRRYGTATRERNVWVLDHVTECPDCGRPHKLVSIEGKRDEQGRPRYYAFRGPHLVGTFDDPNDAREAVEA